MKFFATLCLMVLIIFSKVADADLITFSYSGIIDMEASGGNPDSAPYKAFDGKTIKVEYTFESLTPDNNPSENGDYLGAITSMQVTLDGNVYTGNTGAIIITNNDVNPDQYQVFSTVSGLEIGGISDPQLRMIFSDNTHSVFTSDALPTIQPDPLDFPLGSQINLQFTDYPDKHGNIISNNVHVTPLPEKVQLDVTYSSSATLNGPLSFGLTALPTEVNALFVLGAGETLYEYEPGEEPSTLYSIDDVELASVAFGDAVWTQLETFSLIVNSVGEVTTLSYRFSPIITSAAPGSIVLNFPLTIIGKDMASGNDFEYQYTSSTAVISDYIPPNLAVDIDIKPGSYPNSINLSSGGVTTAAVLGSADFDVNNINPETLMLGTAGLKTVGKKDKVLCSIEDVSGDFSLSLAGEPDGYGV